MTGHNGFFKVGDYVEISGKPEGIIVFADGETFGIRPIRGRSMEGVVTLEPFIRLYSNDAKHYQESYWIRVKHDKPPFEYKELVNDAMLLR